MSQVCVFLGEFILGGCFPGTYISGAYVTCVNASPTSKYYRWSVEYQSEQTPWCLKNALHIMANISVSLV